MHFKSFRTYNWKNASIVFIIIENNYIMVFDALVYVATITITSAQLSVICIL